MSPQITLAATMSLIPEDGELVQAVEVPNQGNLCSGELKFVFESTTLIEYYYCTDNSIFFILISEPDDKMDHLKNLLWQYQNNRSITSDTTHYVILTIYILLCVAAILANSLIVWAVVRNKKVWCNY